MEIHLSDEEFNELANNKAHVKIVKYSRPEGHVHTITNLESSVWRPLATVRHSPLVLCDRQSVKVNDILETDQVAPTKVELSMSLIYRESQKYWWLSDQTPEEIIMFTSWDSHRDQGFSSRHIDFAASIYGLLTVLAKGHTPHGSWINAPLETNVAARESIEVRLIVIWKNDTDHPT